MADCNCCDLFSIQGVTEFETYYQFDISDECDNLCLCLAEGEYIEVYDWDDVYMGNVIVIHCEGGPGGWMLQTSKDIILLNRYQVKSYEHCSSSSIISSSVILSSSCSCCQLFALVSCTETSPGVWELIFHTDCNNLADCGIFFSLFDRYHCNLDEEGDILMATDYSEVDYGAYIEVTVEFNGISGDYASATYFQFYTGECPPESCSEPSSSSVPASSSSISSSVIPSSSSVISSSSISSSIPSSSTPPVPASSCSCCNLYDVYYVLEMIDRLRLVIWKDCYRFCDCVGDTVTVHTAIGDYEVDVIDCSSNDWYWFLDIDIIAYTDIDWVQLMDCSSSSPVISSSIPISSSSIPSSMSSSCSGSFSGMDQITITKTMCYKYVLHSDYEDLWVTVYNETTGEYVTDVDGNLLVNYHIQPAHDHDHWDLVLNDGEDGVIMIEITDDGGICPSPYWIFEFCSLWECIEDYIEKCCDKDPCCDDCNEFAQKEEILERMTAYQFELRLLLLDEYNNNQDRENFDPDTIDEIKELYDKISDVLMRCGCLKSVNCK